MGVISAMAVITLVAKLGIGLSGSVGIIKGLSWFNKKDSKKNGGVMYHDIERETEGR